MLKHIRNVAPDHNPVAVNFGEQLECVLSLDNLSTCETKQGKAEQMFHDRVFTDRQLRQVWKSSLRPSLFKFTTSSTYYGFDSAASFLLLPRHNPRADKASNCLMIKSTNPPVMLER